MNPAGLIFGSLQSLGLSGGSFRRSAPGKGWKTTGPLSQTTLPLHPPAARGV